MSQTHFGKRRVNPFTHPISRPKRLGPEHNPWFWHPNRVDVQFAPDDFRQQIKEIDPSYEVTWNPIRERWQVFARAPKINHPICQGWKLVFVVEIGGEHIPLDNRTLAKAWDRSARKWGNPNAYFEAILNEIEAAEKTRERDRKRENDAGSGDYFDYMKIKNIGHGSKFVNHHSGNI